MCREREMRTVRDELAEREVVQPRAWAREMLGVRPGQYRGGQHDPERARATRGSSSRRRRDAGLGSEPEGAGDRSAWRQAQCVAEQRRLGRDVAEERELDIGIDR